MGVVYEAEQISLGRRVALKVLPRQVSGDRMVRERFRREARAAARLHHTNIVPVFEVGQDRDVRFYAMQFIQGQGLESVITELRRLRDRARSETMIKSASEAQSHSSRPEPSRLRIEGPNLGEEVEVSAVLQSIIAGRFDPGGRSPEPVEAPRSMQPVAHAGNLTTQPGTSMERGPTESGSALKRTEIDSAIIGDPSGPGRTHRLATTASSSAPASSSSAILPGGTQLSSAESGRRGFFRSLAQIGRQVAGGLAYAHAGGIIHRDIKPSNLLLDTEGVVWIADFGLAKGDDEGLTHTGDILGTIRYMAPERFRGESDARSDVYALGMTLYELLTLRPGFHSADRLELIEQIKTEEPPRPRSVDARIPRDLETIVLKAIEKDPKARYQSAQAMGEDLGRFLADEPIRARQISTAERFGRWAKRNPVIAGLGGVLIGVLVLATVCSLVAMERFRIQAQTQRALASSREDARKGADLARAEEAAARLKADQANTSLRATQEELHRTVYATRSNLALAAWDANDVGRLGTLLDMLRPAPGEPDLRGWEWRYLWQLGHEDRLTLGAREDHFADVVFSPDGRIIAGLGDKGRIQLWDRRTGELLRMTGVTNGGRLADLAGGVGALAFSPDGHSLAGPGPDGSLVLYAVDTGRPTLSFEGPPEAVQKLAWSPDGRTLVAAISKHVMRLWDATTRQPLITFTGHTAEIGGLVFTSDGRTVLSGGYDQTIQAWDPATGDVRYVLQGHSGAVHDLALGPDGRTLASVGSDKTCILWDLPGRRPRTTLRGHTDMVNRVAFSPDGRTLATSSNDNTVRLWDAADGSPRGILEGHTDDVYGLAFSPDGRLASSGWDKTIRLWDPASGQTLLILKGHAGLIRCIKFSPDGRTIASAGYDRTIKLWEAAPPAVLARP